MNDLIKRIEKKLEKKAILVWEDKEPRYDDVFNFSFVLVDGKRKKATDLITILYKAEENRFTLFECISLTEITGNMLYINTMNTVNGIVNDYNEEEK